MTAVTTRPANVLTKEEALGQASAKKKALFYDLRYWFEDDAAEVLGNLFAKKENPLENVDEVHLVGSKTHLALKCAAVVVNEILIGLEKAGVSIAEYSEIQRTATMAIADKMGQAEALLRECCQLSKEHSIPFRFSMPNGVADTHNPDGWEHSRICS